MWNRYKSLRLNNFVAKYKYKEKHTRRYLNHDLQDTLAWDSFYWFLHRSKIYIPNIKAFQYTYLTVFLNLPTSSICYHSVVTQLTWSLILRQLSQCWVRLYIDWVNVNAEWDSTSTVSMQNDKIFVNLVAFSVKSVNVDSHSASSEI
jgi:hypothetical protein